MKGLLLEQLSDLQVASLDLERLTPVHAGRGWDPELDASALQRMKHAWMRGRDAYERIEGALAPLFPQSDVATDARYDGFLAILGPAGDQDLFDDKGVTGMHAMERILWANSIPPGVADFEARLPGYHPAAMPRDSTESAAFKTLLAHKLVTDVSALKEQVASLDLDLAFVFRGLMDLTREQLEKVDLAATGREESRYAQTTLRDLRSNREGCLSAYKLFQPWLRSRGYQQLDARVLTGYERLRIAYDNIAGDALPIPPKTWTSLSPRPEDAATPFGRLFCVVQAETDYARSDSLSTNLMAVADALGLPKAVMR